MEDVTCPQCHKEVSRHCNHCGWLVCGKCKIVYGKNNYLKQKKK